MSTTPGATYDEHGGAGGGTSTYGGGPQGGMGYGPGGGGYGGGWSPGMGMMRRQYPIETKPFFLTSEFAALVLAIAGLAITAGTTDDVDSRLFWILTTALVSFYMLSRGIAKSGTRSMSQDPRENIEWGRGGGSGGSGR